jgi:hypothetical protein
MAECLISGGEEIENQELKIEDYRERSVKPLQAPFTCKFEGVKIIGL